MGSVVKAARRAVKEYDVRPGELDMSSGKLSVAISRS